MMFNRQNKTDHNIYCTQTPQTNFNSSPNNFHPLGFSSPVRLSKQRNIKWKKKFNPFCGETSESSNPDNSSNQMKPKPRFHHNFKNFSTTNQEDISLYYNHSMVEDPWKGLEEYLKQKNSIDDNTTKSSLMSSTNEISSFIKDDALDSQGNEDSQVSIEES